MKFRQLVVPAVIAAVSLSSSAAFAQPETKLTRNLPQATVDAIWCSSLLLEEAFWAEGTAQGSRFEDMAYELGDRLDVIMGESGLSAIEIQEVWTIFEDEAFYVFMMDDDFIELVDACYETYRAEEIALR